MAQSRRPEEGGSGSSLAGVQARSGGSGRQVALVAVGGACIRQAPTQEASTAICAFEDNARTLRRDGLVRRAASQGSALENP
jgi:hypothetical protein